MSKENEDSLEQVKIKIIMMPNMAFITALMLNVRFSWGDKVPTAGAKGMEVMINPKFWESIDKPFRIFLVLHEVWHIALDHNGRRDDGNLEPKRYNYAADYEVNGLLKAAGITIPQGSLLDPQYKDMAVEDIYKLLPASPQEPNPLEGDLLEEPADREEVKEAIITAATQAAMADQAGTLPESVQRFVDSVMNPKLPWNVLLMNYLDASLKEDYSWSRRNMRYRDVYMPGMHSEGLESIAVYEDMSGSITLEEHSIQVKEMTYIKELMNPETMTFNGFTTVLGETQSYSRDEEITPDFSMSGGTDIGPVIDDIRNKKPNISVIFTDGYFSMPNLDDLSPVIWVIVNNKGWTTTFGKVIHMTI